MIVKRILSMRFAITVLDLYGPIFDTFLKKGWTPVKLFVWTVDHIFDEHRAAVETAERLKIPIQMSRMRDEDMADLAERGCDVLIGAGYRWRIGDWSKHLKYAVNFHPAPLPEGRGPYPVVQAIREGRREWATTCHKFAPDFDTGDILDQEKFPFADDETHESATIRMRMASQRLAERVADDLPGLWERAQPQVGGTYYNRWTDEERTLDFTKTVEENMRKYRAFGKIEVMAVVNESNIFVRNMVGWTEEHSHTLGWVIHVYRRHTVIAVKDGYLCLIDWSYIDPFRAQYTGR
jgi:methionyl-tRNA formyltransferase